MRQLKDVHNVILLLKPPIMKKISLSHDPSHLKVIKTLYHDIIKDKVEYIIIFSQIFLIMIILIIIIMKVKLIIML